MKGSPPRRSWLSDATTKRSQLEVELSDLRAKVAVLKEKLNRLRMTGGRIVDTDLLLAAAGHARRSADELAATMKKEEASAALDELKKKMRDTGGPRAAEGHHDRYAERDRAPCIPAR